MLSAEQLVAAGIEVSLSRSCSTSSGIGWDFTKLQSYPKIYPGGVDFAGVAKFGCLETLGLVTNEELCWWGFPGQGLQDSTETTGQEESACPLPPPASPAACLWTL